MGGNARANSGGKNQRPRVVGVLEKVSSIRSADWVSWEDTPFLKGIRNAGVRGTQTSITNRLSGGSFRRAGLTAGDAVTELLSLVAVRVMESSQ